MAKRKNVKYDIPNVDWTSVIDRMAETRRKRDDETLVVLKQQTLLLDPSKYDDSALIDLYVQTYNRSSARAVIDVRQAQQYAIGAQKLREELLRRMAKK